MNSGQPVTVGTRQFYFTNGSDPKTRVLHAFALDENKEMGRLEIRASSSYQVYALGGDRFVLVLDFMEMLPSGRDSHAQELRLWELGQKESTLLDSCPEGP